MVTTRKGYWIPVAIILIVLVALVNYHADKFHLPVTWVVAVNIASFLWIMLQILLAHLNPEYKATRRELARFNVSVIIPCYNEDAVTFRAMLDSLNNQTRLPDSIHVVDDGSKTDDCALMFKDWQKTTTITATYTRQVNSGKREAQARAFALSPEATIYVTLDSDTVLDERAIEQGLKPFARKDVMSVAGLLLSLNDRSNLLTRLIDLGFVTSFMNGRAAWSQMHSVAVNCGGLAFYRASIVRKYLYEYLNHTVLGVKATCGDDRMLTNFALLDGWTVFQESSVGYTLIPDRLNHLTKQRVRWWRSFFWGSEWLLRRFSMKRLVWWLVAYQLVSFALYTVIVPFVLILTPLVNQHLPLAFFAYIFVLSYIRDIRYLSIKRPDQPYRQQLLTYLLAPLSTLLHMYLCTVLQYVGLVTFYKMNWNTRATVEVGIDATT